MITRCTLRLAVLLPLVLGNCAIAQTVKPQSIPSLAELGAGGGQMPGIIRRFTTDRDSINQYFSGFGSIRLPLSPARDAREREFYGGWLVGLEKISFDGLVDSDKADYLLFKNHIQRHLKQLEIQGKNNADAAPLIPFAQTIIDLAESRQKMENLDPARTAVTLNELNKRIDEAKKNVEKALKVDPRFKKSVANRAATNVSGLRDALGQWYRFYNGYDPLFTWWMEAPYKAVDESLQSYATLIREKLVGIKPDDKTTIIGYPIGKEALLAELAFEMIPYSPDDLVDLANKEFAWCEAEMKKASHDMGFGDDWHKALEKVKTLYVEPGKQPELIRNLAQEAIEYVEKNDLVTVPPLCKETWRMTMMSPQQQLANPFFLGGDVIQVSYPTSSMSHEQKMMSMRGNNPHFSRATVFHELIPGHHLQGFMEERYRPYRSIFSTPFYTEGWALYWEMTFWDKGFPRSPEDRVGMLFWRMHRCARIIFSLGFHLGKMTPQECIDFLVERVGHERDNAAAEVRRSFSGAYGPLYQAAYMLGALELRALRRELVDTGKVGEKQFHDAVLQENNIPIAMLRAILTKQALKSDSKMGWKFYGK